MSTRPIMHIVAGRSRLPGLRNPNSAPVGGLEAPPHVRRNLTAYGAHVLGSPRPARCRVRTPWRAGTTADEWRECHSWPKSRHVVMTTVKDGIGRTGPFKGDRAVAHVVAVMALHGLVPFDPTVPWEVFGRAALPSAAPLYEVRVCGEAASVRSEHFDLRALAPRRPHRRRHGDRPGDRGHRGAGAGWGPHGLAGCGRSRGAHRLDLHRRLRAGGSRPAGRSARHHALAARFPRVQVDADVLYMDQGRILTSAGAAGARQANPSAAARNDRCSSPPCPRCGPSAACGCRDRSSTLRAASGQRTDRVALWASAARGGDRRRR